MLRPFIFLTHTLLLILSPFTLTLAAPTHEHEPQSRALSRRAEKPSQSQIDSANGMFPGIDWSYTAENGECDSGQFAVLVEATRMALELMKFTGEDLRVAYDTTGFNRYFMRHPDWFKLRIFDFASQKYFGVYKWPTETPKKNLRQYKTAYYCAQPAWSSGCGKATNPPAYTVDTKPDAKPPGSRDPIYPYSNSIVFCPKFWNEFKYVNDVTETPGRQLKNIDDLHSYEHAIIHEWFHNRKNDVASLHIEDIKGDYGDGERNIYGSYASQHYAWRHVLKGGGVGDLEFHTMMNADSFAWMISYNWFKSIYNWNNDGSMNPPKKRQDEDPEEVSDPYKDLPLDEDAVDDDMLTDPEDSSMPEATTYNRNDCPNCLITDGGCVAVPECRYPQDNGVVDSACTHCTCDVDKNDNNNSTEDVSLSDAKCAGWAGTLPADYKWPPTPTSTPTPTATPPPDDFNCNCGESGCSADSAPCCANGSCACHCSESGCAEDDPACCANGTCHFGAMRMLF